MKAAYALLCLLILLTKSDSAALAQESDFVQVMVAAQDLPRGLLLTEDLVLGENALVKIAFYPADSLPATAIQNPGELIGNYLRTDIPTENPIVQHYLFPDPAARPLSEIPYPISPPGYRVTRTYGEYTEMVLDDLDQVFFPAGLAAGDTVDIIATTGLHNILLDETGILAQSLVVASITESSITLSVTDPQPISEFLATGLPITLVLHNNEDTSLLNDGSNRITWEYLTTRLDNPLEIPDGANLSTLGGQ